MAKAKDEVKTDHDPNIENPDGSLRTIKQRADEAKRLPEVEAELEKERQKVLEWENRVADLLPELFRYRYALHGTVVGRDCGLIYEKFRAYLGARGESIDAKMRG